MPTPKRSGVIDAVVHRLICDGGITIMPLSDLHIGDSNCNYQLIEKLVEEIRTGEDTYTLLIGDLMNTAIIGSKSDAYAEQLTPAEQIEKCVEYLAPISEKILGIVPGNHEERISKTAGIDTTQIIAARLGLLDLYRPTSELVMLNITDEKNVNKKKSSVLYSIYINHGHGGGRKVGGKANGLQDFASIIDADIFIQGHTHQPLAFRQSHYRISNQNFNATPHEMVLVNLPSALTYGGYGNRNGYQPPSNTYPRLLLSASGHDIEVVI